VNSFPAPPIPRADLEHILLHTEPLWRELAGARLFITGGTGFFGHWLLETLAYARQRLNLSLHATLLTRAPQVFAQSMPHLAADAMFDWCVGDVRRFAFPVGEFSHLAHMGGTSSSRNPGEMLDVILEGSRHILRFAAACRCRRFLLISSGAVYGAQPPECPRLSEDFPCAPDPMRPDSAYGEGKRVAELLSTLAAKEHGFAAIIARCFAFLGPHLPLDAHYAAGNFLRDALNGGPVRVKSDGRPLRSYLYMADLMVWLLTLLVRGESCRPYNVGSDEALSLAALAECIRDTLAPGVPVRIEGAMSRGSAPRYIPDIDRAKRELGLGVVIRLPEAIKRTADWLRTKA
jgi:dTDP-glucose 4,6-dehydratase